MEEKTKLQSTTKGEYVWLAFCAVIILFCIGVVGWLTLRSLSAREPDRDGIVEQTSTEEDQDATVEQASTEEDRYTQMVNADGTKNFPMIVEDEIGDEYIASVEFSYAEPVDLPSKHCTRIIYYIGEETKTYAGYADFWVNSDYDGEQNPLLLPEVAEYDPLEDRGLSLSELFDQAVEDANSLPEDTFYCADNPGSISVHDYYGKNTIVYFYTAEKGKVAAIMFDWSTNLTHAAFYD